QLPWRVVVAPVADPEDVGFFSSRRRHTGSLRDWSSDVCSSDLLFLAITIITGIAFVLVEVGLIWFVVKYRQRPGQKAFYTHGNTRAEVIWTTIPAVTMVALGLISNHYWVKIKGRHSVPANAYAIAIHAKQFEWQVTYPGADGQLGTSDDFTVRNQLHVPVGRPVVVHLSSEDVIHSLFVPVFRVTQA